MFIIVNMAHKTLVSPPDQPADRAGLVTEFAVAIDHGRWGPMDAELVLDGVAMQVVAAAEGAIIVHEELRHEEERDALRALRRIRKARKHQMDDVVGKSCSP